MSYSARGEAKRTQAAKGRAMGVKNEYLPEMAARINGAPVDKTVAPPASQEAPQFPEDKRGDSGDVSPSWLTGKGLPPNFDRG